MGIVLKSEITVSNKFRDIIKRQQYEKLVLATLNRSKLLISNLPLTHVNDQSYGQSDFVDSVGLKYDVKLLLEEKQGSYIGEQKNNILLYFQSMMNEASEFSECVIETRDLSLVINTKFYKLVKKFVRKFRDDEIGILFIPYPIVQTNTNSVILQFATDFIQAVYNRLEEENAIRCLKLLFLYPDMKTGYFILRHSYFKESIVSPEISDYIDFKTVMCIE